MTDLKLIENELVPVYETNTGEKLVNGRELYEVLKSKQDFSTWVKKRLEECDTIENTDYTCFHKKMEANNATMIEYIIKLDTAKEMAMLERNEIGKQVRKYFIEIEKKYKQQNIDASKLSPELQMFNQMFSVMAKQELKLNQLEDKTNKVAETMQTVADTFVKAGETENFNKWVNASMDRIANSDKFIAIGCFKYQLVKGESYKRLENTAHCDLKTLVKNAKARAKKAGATVTQQNTINALLVIANNNRLKAIYTTVVKEMLLAYCMDYVEVGAFA